MSDCVVVRENEPISYLADFYDQLWEEEE